MRLLPAFSLRTKITLGMVLLSLASIAAVGWFANQQLMRKFDEALSRDASARFSREVAAYIHTYGSWQAGLEHESFRTFGQRNARLINGPAPGGPGGPGGADGPGIPPGGGLIAAPIGVGAPAQEMRGPRGPDGRGEPGMGGQESGMRPGGEGPPREGPPRADEGPRRAGEGRPPDGPPRDGPPQGMERGGPPSDGTNLSSVPKGTQAPHVSNLTRPPFRFYLFDTESRSLFRLAPYDLGSTVTEEHRARLRPIEDGGKTVAYFIPEGKPNYSELDLSYIAAMQNALLTGGAAAAVLALVLGLLLSYRLSGGLRQLTRAAQAMERGQLKQHVDVSSRDEVGQLAEAFNQMSARLHEVDAQLRESHAQVEQQAAQLKELAIRDGLTGLHNRRHFDENGEHLLSLARRHDKPFAVMMGDIDFFKRINDTYSHAVGDQVLVRVADLLSARVRGTDLLARYGGEEFVIAFPETSLEAAARTCETLRAQIEAHDWSAIHPDLTVTVSMGVADHPQAQDLYALVAHADARLYAAKHAGRNRVCSADAAGEQAEVVV